SPRRGWRNLLQRRTSRTPTSEFRNCGVAPFFSKVAHIFSDLGVHDLRHCSSGTPTLEFHMSGSEMRNSARADIFCDVGVPERQRSCFHMAWRSCRTATSEL